MKSLIQKILTTKAQSKSEEIQQALKELNARRQAINARLEEIRPGDAINGPDGPVRRQVMLTGTPADLVALDTEQRELFAERDQALPAQEHELNQRLSAAQASEAAAALPGRIKALGPALERHQEALSKLQAAQAELDRIVSGVISARRLVGTDAPSVPQKLVDSLAAVRGLDNEPDRPDRFNLARARLFSDLGAELPERARPDYNPHPGRSGGEFERDESEDLDRHPEQSIWNRNEPGGRAA